MCENHLYVLLKFGNTYKRTGGMRFYETFVQNVPCYLKTVRPTAHNVDVFLSKIKKVPVFCGYRAGDRAGCCLRGSDFFFSDYSVVHTIL